PARRCSVLYPALATLLARRPPYFHALCVAPNSRPDQAMQANNPRGAQAATPRPLGRRDYKTLGLAALGGALEFYDFIIFVFFAPAIGQLFFPAAMPDWLR